jgi:2,4-dienoyl-CoA reductase-like NADH-dependent reductase (Old Yellow Enzyme family)
MEGCDGTEDGAPGELTVRRYDRSATGGAGLIWFEACAVVPAGRANPRPLWLHNGNVAAFRSMVEESRAAAHDAAGHRPVFVLQLTHSGRYSRPGGRPTPVIAHHSPILNPQHDLPVDYPLIADEALDAVQDDFVRAAALAADAGFDAVDIKACHRYLFNELLASHTRPGRYGGDYEGRTRMLRETFAKVRDAAGERLEVTTRLNAYDGIPHPYGWGVDECDPPGPDLTEPLRLLRELGEAGLSLVNITGGNPYSNPHVNRPADQGVARSAAPPEHPLAGVARLLAITRDIQRGVPEMIVVGSGYSWLREYAADVAAGAVCDGWAQVVGLGRGALAYPDFALDVLRGEGMDRNKVCITCSGCTQIMRDGGRAGCIVRDAEVYGPIHRAGRKAAQSSV